MVVNLLPWEHVIYNACIGFFILGLILFLLTLFLQGMHFFGDVDHDVSHDVGHDLDHDVSMDAGHGVGHDFDADHDFEGGTPAPIFLLAATLVLAAGSVGILLYSIELDPLIRLISTLVIPLVCVYGVSRIWRNITKHASLPPIKEAEINDTIFTVTSVDEDGGIVLVKFSENESKKSPAKTPPGVKLARGTKGYVIGKEGEILVVDEYKYVPLT
ncbi:MAG: hypothetical protein ACXAEU_10265 [Candidatus Hodarchaeales archaeon]|jgi:hypothetical protein